MVHYSFAKAANNNNKLNDSFFLAWHAPIVIQNNNFSLSSKSTFRHTHTHSQQHRIKTKCCWEKKKKSYHFAVMKCHDLRWRVRVIPNKEERMRVSKIAWEWVRALAKEEKKSILPKRMIRIVYHYNYLTLYIGHLVAKH